MPTSPASRTWGLLSPPEAILAPESERPSADQPADGLFRLLQPSCNPSPRPPSLTPHLALLCQTGVTLCQTGGRNTRESQTSFSTRSVTFRPSFRGIFVSLGRFRPSLIRFRPSFRVCFRLSRSVSTPSEPFATLLLRVFDGLDPLPTPNEVSTPFSRRSPCLTLTLILRSFPDLFLGS
jgi:hypothetical protein